MVAGPIHFYPNEDIKVFNKHQVSDHLYSLILYIGAPCVKVTHIAPCVKVVEWGLGTRRLRILAAFWAGILVEVTQEASVVPG